MRRPMTKLAAAVVVISIPLVAALAWAQSATTVGSTFIEVRDPLGLIFEVRSFVPTSEVVLGESGGADVDLHVKDPNFIFDQSSLHFNATSANLTLGSGTGSETGDDGDLILEDGTGVTTIHLSGGDGGRATQPVDGEGFVKAWVRVLGLDGTVLSSRNVASVERTSLGVYHVFFSPNELAERPIAATLDGHALTPVSGGISIGLDDGFHTGAKQVFTFDKNGDAADRSFNLVVY